MNVHAEIEQCLAVRQSVPCNEQYAMQRPLRHALCNDRYAMRYVTTTTPCKSLRHALCNEHYHYAMNTTTGTLRHAARALSCACLFERDWGHLSRSAENNQIS